MENEQYDEILKDDAEAIQEYIDNIYSMKVPPPLKPTDKDLSFWNIVGIESSLFTIAALAGAVVSSVRTGGLFYILENLLLKKFNLVGGISSVLSSIVLIASLLAFEGYLLAFGFAKGRTMKSAKASNMGLAAAFIVIIIAGIFSGVGLVQIPANVEQGFYITLALVTALGAALVTLLGGENIGFSLEKYKAKKDEILNSYQDKYNAYIAKAVKSYGTSHYSKLRSGGIQNEQQNEQDVNSPIKNSVQPLSNEPKTKKSEQCREKIKHFVLEMNRLPTITEMEQTTGYSRALISYAINDFVSINSEKLLGEGIVDQERIEQANISYEKRSVENAQL